MYASGDRRLSTQVFALSLEGHYMYWISMKLVIMGCIAGKIVLHDFSHVLGFISILDGSWVQIYCISVLCSSLFCFKNYDFWGFGESIVLWARYYIMEKLCNCTQKCDMLLGNSPPWQSISDRVQSLTRMSRLYRLDSLRTLLPQIDYTPLHNQHFYNIKEQYLVRRSARPLSG